MASLCKGDGHVQICSVSEVSLDWRPRPTDTPCLNWGASLQQLSFLLHIPILSLIPPQGGHNACVDAPAVVL